MTQADSVTVRPKRYARVFVCAGCDKLATSERSHSITCCPACRTRVHRNPDLLASLRSTCAALKVEVAMVLEAKALNLLRPDLGPRVMAGELTLEQCRPEVWPAFWARMTEVANVAQP